MRNPILLNLSTCTRQSRREASSYAKMARMFTSETGGRLDARKNERFLHGSDALNCKAPLWTAPDGDCKPGWSVLRRNCACAHGKTNRSEFEEGTRVAR